MYVCFYTYIYMYRHIKEGRERDKTKERERESKKRREGDRERGRERKRKRKRERRESTCRRVERGRTDREGDCRVGISQPYPAAYEKAIQEQEQLRHVNPCHFRTWFVYSCCMSSTFSWRITTVMLVVNEG